MVWRLSICFLRLASEEEVVAQPESAAPSAGSDPGVLQMKVRPSMIFAPLIDDRSQATRKRARLRYVNVQTSVYLRMHDPHESSADFPKFLSGQDQRRLTCALRNMRMSCNSSWLLDQETDHGVKADELATLFESLFAWLEAKAVVFSQWTAPTRSASAGSGNWASAVRSRAFALSAAAAASWLSLALELWRAARPDLLGTLMRHCWPWTAGANGAGCGPDEEPGEQAAGWNDAYFAAALTAAVSIGDSGIKEYVLDQLGAPVSPAVLDSAELTAVGDILVQCGKPLASALEERLATDVASAQNGPISAP